MKNILQLLIILCLFIPSHACSTVSYLTVNHLTQELYWGDEDHSTGFIGWEGIPDGIYQESEKKYIQLGYTFTQFPFKIETAILGTLLVLTVFIFNMVRTRLTKRKAFRAGVQRIEGIKGRPK